MSTPLTLSLGRPTLADRLLTRGIGSDLVLVAAGAGLTAIAAQLVIPLWPVPITGQTLAVLLVGSTLGATRGVLSMILYALLGIFGLPVFSEGTHGLTIVMGPTGGYIIGFILAAALTGWLAQRSWDHRLLGAILSFLAGSAVTFAVGLPWLAVSLGLNLQQTLVAGLYPFIIGGIVKAVLAAGFIRLAWLGINRNDERNAEDKAM
ncbi:MAG: biotin transporter BioY [Microbacteriaceae bacterium]|nr:biotin transporter BioY [Microbacteriaceae bacterium]